jgi:hypothetical protein
VPRSLQPCFLAGTVYIGHPGNPRLLRPLHGSYFSIPVGAGRGEPDPLGATVVHKSPHTVAMPLGQKTPHVNVQQQSEDAAPTTSINFSVVSRHASTFSNLLFAASALAALDTIIFTANLLKLDAASAPNR